VLNDIRQARMLPREIWLYLLFTLFANIGIGVFTLIYNLYLVRNALHEDFIGTYNAVQTVSVGVVALGMGWLINRYGSWACITYGTAFYFAMSALLALLTNPTLILITAALMGAGMTSLIVPVMPFIVEWGGREHRSSAAALSFSFSSIAMTVGSLLGGWAPRVVATLAQVPADSSTAYRATLLIGTALAIVGLAPMWAMRHARPRHDVEVASPAAPAEIARDRRQVRKDIGVFILAGIFMSFGAGAVVPFFNVFLVDLGLPTSRIGLIFSLAGIVAAGCGLFAPTLSRRLGPLPAVLLVRLSPAPLYLFLAAVPNTGIAILAHVVRTTSISMAWPIDSTFVADLLPSRARAFAYSLRSGAWNLGFAVSSLVAGQLIVSRGYSFSVLAYATFSSVSALTFVGYYARHPRVRGKRERQPGTALAD
jgi:MFS family permease